MNAKKHVGLTCDKAVHNYMPNVPAFASTLPKLRNILNLRKTFSSYRASPLTCG